MGRAKHGNHCEGGVIALIELREAKHLDQGITSFPGGSVVKNSPAMLEMQFQSLGQDLLEKEIAAHSSILAWENPWTEEADGPQSMGLQRSQTQLSN